MSLLLLFISQVSSQTICPIYSCFPPLPSGVCQASIPGVGLSYTSLASCPFGTSCMSSQGYGLCESSFAGRPVGFYCTSASECTNSEVGGQCISNMCTQAAICITTADCTANYFCYNYRCVPAIPPGSSIPCEFNYQCQLGSFCDFNNCTKQTSKSNGDYTSVLLTQNYAPVCQSYFATQASQGIYICQQAPQSPILRQTQCVPGEKCYAKDGINYKICQCGFSGMGFCPLFEGDSYVQQLFQGLDLYRSYVACNNLDPLSYECLVTRNYPSFLGLLYVSYLYFDYYWVYTATSNSECVTSNLMVDYTNVYNQYKSGITDFYTDVCPIVVPMSNGTFPQDQCVFIFEEIIDSRFAVYAEASVCNSSSYCNLQNTEGFCSPLEIKNFAGEYCQNNSQCSSHNCSNNLCVGNSINQTCTYGSCNLGLYCNSALNMCKPVPQIGQKCGQDRTCDTYLTCANGICAQMFSVNTGDSVFCQNTTISPHINELCEFGYAKVEYLLGEALCTCVKLSPDYSPPTLCGPVKDNCPLYPITLINPYDDNPFFVNSTSCECSFDGNRYCPVTLLNFRYFNTMGHVKNLMATQRKCNGDVGLSYGCFAYDSTILATYFAYYTNYSYVQNSTFFWTNNTYAIAALIPEYYWAMNMLQSLPPPLPIKDGDIRFAIISFLFLILIV